MTFGIANAVLMQTGFVKATLAQGLTLTVDWGARSQALQAKLSTASGTSFLIASPSGSPVTVGTVADADLASWDTATTTSVPVTRNGTDTKVKATFPPLLGPSAPNHLNVRLDFSLTVTAGGQSAVVLSFSQLLLLDSSNALTTQNCAIDNTFLTPGSNGPVKGSPSGAPAPPVHRTFPGSHPLVTINQTPGPAVGTTATVLVNAEFVDLTLLWWALRKDALNWYLNLALPKPGRQANLRVLGWTGGGNPMLWFAVIPDAAASSIGAGTEDLVFFRPQAGVNSFPYPATEAGLTDSRHDGQSPFSGNTSTLYVLARYLLSPIPSDQLATVRAAGTVQNIELLADQVQAGGTPPASPSPPDPMSLLSRPLSPSDGFPFAFRPVGMEGAFNNAGGSRVLFLPLASGDTAAPYEGGTIAGLKTTTHSALGTLWTVGAVDASGTAVPTFDGRELWLGAHSGANMSMWLSAQKNAADISRIITIDASPWGSNLQNGITTITQVNKTRTGAGKSLDVFAIVSPNLGQGKSPSATQPFLGLDDDTDLKLRKTGASITVLPDFSRRESFWNPLPPAAAGSPKSFVQYLLSQWIDGGTTINATTPSTSPPPSWIATSAATPSHWRFLFFHETAMDGGDLVAGSTPTSSPTVKTFFEQALGAPSPRPPP